MQDTALFLWKCNSWDIIVSLNSLWNCPELNLCPSEDGTKSLGFSEGIWRSFWGLMCVEAVTCC